MKIFEFESKLSFPLKSHNPMLITADDDPHRAFKTPPPVNRYTEFSEPSNPDISKNRF